MYMSDCALAIFAFVMVVRMATAFQVNTASGGAGAGVGDEVAATVGGGVGLDCVAVGPVQPVSRAMTRTALVSVDRARIVT
jgi:hypothetical protein